MRTGRECVKEENSICGQTIEERRCLSRIAIAPKVIVTERVNGNQHHDIRLREPGSPMD